MKRVIQILVVIIFVGCGKADKHAGSIEMITESDKQDSLFNGLMEVTGNSISAEKRIDSLAFLILPVHASCPPCREKTIDSIVKYKDQLRADLFIVISANGGRKIINSYFREEDLELPVMDRLFLDSSNIAYENKLYKDKPTIYYTYNMKAYKKVGAIPSTIRQDLQEFFSGYRTIETE